MRKQIHILERHMSAKCGILGTSSLVQGLASKTLNRDHRFVSLVFSEFQSHGCSRGKVVLVDLQLIMQCHTLKTKERFTSKLLPHSLICNYQFYFEAISHHFYWNLRGFDEPEFAALVDLLLLRNGQQLEPLSSADDLLQTDTSYESSDDGASDDSTHPRLVSYSGHDRLKKRFLDASRSSWPSRKGGICCLCSYEGV